MNEGRPSSPPIRSKLNAHQTQAPPSPPIRSKFQSENTQPPPSPPQRKQNGTRKSDNNNNAFADGSGSSDSLDKLSKSFPSPKNPEKGTYRPTTPTEPGIVNFKIPNAKTYLIVPMVQRARHTVK